MRQTHRQQFMSEISVSAGALRRAAGHLALGTAERLTPTYDRARYAAQRGWVNTQASLKPVYRQMQESAIQARMNRPTKRELARRNRSRMRSFASLLAAGAAVGAAGAAVARRRRAHQAEWEEYDPVTGETRYMGSRYADESRYGHKSTRERVTAGAASMADNLSSRAGRMADALHERTETMQERSGQGAHPGETSGMPPRASGPMTGRNTMGGGMAAPNPPGTVLGPGKPSNQRTDRLGDPALGFPDEP
jgi:hypothetical protein